MYLISFIYDVSDDLSIKVVDAQIVNEYNNKNVLYDGVEWNMNSVALYKNVCGMAVFQYYLYLGQTDIGFISNFIEATRKFLRERNLNELL
jgi:hypothetical protein